MLVTKMVLLIVIIDEHNNSVDSTTFAKIKKKLFMSLCALYNLVYLSQKSQMEPKLHG
jgi:hypothetical protein